MQVMNHTSIQCISLMKNRAVHNLTCIVLALFCTAVCAQAKSVVGDIILHGNVQRAGQQLASDTSIFEGDDITTQRAGGGVLRVGRGRVEIAESTEIEVVRRSPLRIVVKSGTIAFNFPPETPLEIVTPQLEVHPNLADGNLSGVITATPQTEDRVQSRSGNFTVVERQKNGISNHIMPGQVVVAALLPAVMIPGAAAEPISPAPQGPMVGARVAILTAVQPDVRVARAATPNNYARVPVNTPLANGDYVRTLNGRAQVTFDSDRSVITLSEGTTVLIQQRSQANTVTRQITQAIGSLWFSIQRVAGTQTTLSTPTAVAAIRGTEGTQDVPNNTQSTHALNEGIEQVTEVVTSQSVTIRTGQRVTAIRGVGFTPIVALLAAIAQPAVAGGTAVGPPTGVPGGAATATGAAASTVSSVATVAATASTAGLTAAAAAVLPNTVGNNPAPASATTPLNPPGGG
jgi:hypothetical protein